MRAHAALLWRSIQPRRHSLHDPHAPLLTAKVPRHSGHFVECAIQSLMLCLPTSFGRRKHRDARSKQQAHIAAARKHCVRVTDHTYLKKMCPQLVTAPFCSVTPSKEMLHTYPFRSAS
jgi:hypothetical protein